MGRRQGRSVRPLRAQGYLELPSLGVRVPRMPLGASQGNRQNEGGDRKVVTWHRQGPAPRLLVPRFPPEPTEGWASGSKGTIVKQGQAGWASWAVTCLGHEGRGLEWGHGVGEGKEPPGSWAREPSDRRKPGGGSSMTTLEKYAQPPSPRLSAHGTCQRLMPEALRGVKAVFLAADCFVFQIFHFMENPPNQKKK